MSDNSKAVFLSYASQDSEAAKRICEALRASGVEVWFDAEGGLEHGDEWDQKIHRQIKECVLFIAVISAHTQAREEGYFRIEWDLAAERARGIASGVAFILPIVIDDTREPDALVPDRFRKVQWTRLPGGTVPPDVKARFLKLWSHRTGVLNHQTERRRGFEPRPEPPARSRAVIYALAAAAVLAAAVGSWFMLKPRAGSAAAAAPAASSPGKLSEARQLSAQARALIDDDLMAVRENYRLADEFCRRAVALDATDGEAWATAGRVSALILQLKFEMTPDRKELAKTQVERANRLAPASIETGLAQAAYLGVIGEVPQAERMFRQLIQRAPTDKRPWWHLGTILLQAERFDDALGLFRQAAGLLDGDPRCETLRGSLLIRVGRYREAEAVLGRVLQQSPTKAAYSWQLVLLGFYHSDLPAASRFLDQIPPGLMQEDAMINLAAEIWLRLGEGDKALKVLQKSPRDFLEEGFEIRPKGYVAGHALQLAGRPTAALAEWRQALVVMEKRLATNPNQPLLLYWHALLQALTGQKAGAIETRKLFRELEAKPDAWFDAILLVALGDNEQAILGLLEGWPKANFNLRSDIRGDLMYAPWLAAIRSDPRIQSLIAEHTAAIERDRAGPAASRPAADDKSVAVLAFANLSDDKANEYFSDGISEELLNVLAKVPGLKVSARTSAFYFKGKEVPIPEIAKQLGVAYVVEGSVRKAGDKVRITAQLIKAADGFHVWSDTFTRDLKDIFAVQDEIAGLIAKNLELKMGFTAARPTVDLEAYQEYLTGKALFAKATMADLNEAVTHLERAVTIDPKFAAAWVQLASTHTRLGRFGGGVSTLLAWPAARAAIDKARALEPDSPDMLVALGWILRTAEWDWRGAEQAFRRALELRPNHPETLAGTAVLLFNVGKEAEAFRLGQQVAQLDPLNAGPHIDLSLMFYFNRNWAESERSARRALQLAPGGASYHSVLGWSLMEQKRYTEAEKEIALEGDATERITAYGLLAIARGQTAMARQCLEQLETIARTNRDAADLQTSIAWISAGLGDKERAFAALEYARASRDPSMSWLRNGHYLLSPVYSDPRWGALLHKVGLADDQLK